MSSNQEKTATEYQAERMSGAPRRWTYWIAVFTAINGVLLLANQDLTFLVGLVSPFALGGAAPHFVAAAAFALIAYLSSKSRYVLIGALLLYVADAVFSAVLSLWSGVIMHAVVLVLVAIAIASGRKLNAKIASGPGKGGV